MQTMEVNCDLHLLAVLAAFRFALCLTIASFVAGEANILGQGS